MSHRTHATALALALLLSLAAFTSCEKSAATTTSEQDSGKKESAQSQPTSKPAAAHPGLMKPELFTEQAPATFKVEFKTSAGDFTAEIVREWAPLGADRFYQLVKVGYFSDIGIFRVVKGFVAQFGLHGDPKINAVWAGRALKDDPQQPAVSNKRGYITYAHAGKNTRSNQFFINFGNNSDLDSQGFPPIGRVTKGLEVIDKFYDGYPEQQRKAPDQGIIGQRGNEYLKASFPNLSYIKSITIVE